MPWIGPANTYFLITGLMFFAFRVDELVSTITGEEALLERNGAKTKVLSAVWDGLRYSARNKTILLILFILLLSQQR